MHLDGWLAVVIVLGCLKWASTTSIGVAPTDQEKEKGTEQNSHTLPNADMTKRKKDSLTPVPSTSRNDQLLRKDPSLFSAPHIRPLQQRSLSMGEWVQIGGNMEDTTPFDSYEWYGAAVAMSRNGKRVVIARYYGDPSSRMRQGGYARAYEWNGTSWIVMGNQIPLGWDCCGVVGAMSAKGDRVALRTFCDWSDYTDWDDPDRIFEWNGTEWVSHQVDFTYEYSGPYGSISISDDGDRAVLSAETKIGIFEWEESNKQWDEVEDINIPGNRGLSIAGNGKRIAVGGDGVRVYELNSKSSWKQLGGLIDTAGSFERSIAMSRSGKIVAIGGGRPDGRKPVPGSVRVFQWKDSTWTKFGDVINLEAWDDGCSVGVSLSSNGRRLATSCRGNGTRIFQLDKTDSEKESWIQVRNEIEGEGASLSGKGDLVAVSNRHLDYYLGGYMQVFKFESKAMRPFPDDFDKVTCAFVKCLFDLLGDFGSPLVRFSDRKLNEFIEFFREVTSESEEKARRYGNVIASLERLEVAMDWAQRVRTRGSNLGKEGKDAVIFSNKIGGSASTCAVDFVENSINSFLGKNIVDNAFLFGRPTKKLEKAKAKQGAKKWKKSVKQSLSAVRLLLEALEENTVPHCKD